MGKKGKSTEEVTKKYEKSTTKYGKCTSKVRKSKQKVSEKCNKVGKKYNVVKKKYKDVQRKYKKACQSELSAGGTKRDVESTPKCTCLNCILAQQSSLGPPPEGQHRT